MMQDNRVPKLPLDLQINPQLNLPVNLQVDLPTLMEVWQSTLGWQPSTEQHQQFQQLYAGILDGNQRLNLTRITEPTEFWEKHLWDSLSGLVPFLGEPDRQIKLWDTACEHSFAKQDADVPVPEGQIAEGQAPELGASAPDLGAAPEVQLDQDLRPDVLSSEQISALGQLPARPFTVIDIGTGAGFPGIPVAIALQDAVVTLLDSTRKKIAFIDGLLAALNLPNAKTLVERVEQIGQQRHHREAYDIALLRAVAPATVCAEYALPLLKVNGLAILYRGQWTADEEAALSPAIAQLGGTLEHVAQFTTPLSHSTRHCLYLRKVVSTPLQFPRAVGVPTQAPL